MKAIPYICLVVGGLLLLFGGRLSEIPFGGGNVEGSTLLLVNEKTKPSVDQVIGLRTAPAFVETKKLSGFLNVDQDSDLAKSLTPLTKLEPPYAAYVDMGEDRTVKKVRKAKPWKGPLEETL